MYFISNFTLNTWIATSYDHNRWRSSLWGCQALWEAWVWPKEMLLAFFFQTVLSSHLLCRSAAFLDSSRFQNLHFSCNAFPGRSSLWPHYHSHESSLHPSRLTRSLCVIRVLCLNYRRQFRLVTSMRHKKYKLYKRYKCRGWHPCHDQIRNWLLSEISRQLKASKATVLVTHTRWI